MGWAESERALLQQLGFDLASSLSPDGVAAIALQAITTALEPDLAALFVSRGEGLLLAAWWVRDDEWGRPTCGLQQAGECVCAAAARGNPVYVPDIALHPSGAFVDCRRCGIRSLAALPLRGGQEVVGVLALGAREPCDFGRQGAFLERLAGVVGRSLANALAFEDMRARSEELARQLELQVRAEKRLEEQERQLERVMSSLPVGVAVTSQDGQVEYLNDKFVRTFGYTLQDLHTVKDWRRLAYPDERHRRETAQRWREAAEVARREGRDSEPVLVHVTCKDGTVRSVEMTGRSLGDRELFTFHDVTEWRRTEAALRQSGERLRTVIENSPIVLYTLDQDGVFTLSEGKGLAAMGLKPGQVVGCSVFEMYRDYPSVLADICRALQGEAFTTHSRLDDLIFDVWYQPLEDEQGHPCGTIGVALDVTKEQGMLDEKARLEYQLAQSQKMEAVGQLAGGIAHDFNNMLSAITGYASMLVRKLGDQPKLKHYAEQILASSDRSSLLTRQLLAFSRKQVISPAQADLNGLVQGVRKLLERLIGEDVTVSIELCDEPLVALVDTGQIEQVLLNLCTNARDAMPRGGTLSIATRRAWFDEAAARATGLQEPGPYGVLVVADTGIGMDEAVRPRIFEPFFTTKEVGRGTGLGLSIVYGIIRQHGGHISVTSRQGEGTVLKLYLPLVEGLPQAAQPAVVSESRGGTETILVAEDNEVVRSLTRQVLCEFGYSVLEAADGEEAVACFQAHRDQVDLVVLDVIMPKQSGRDVAEAMRRARPDVLILYTSGYTADFLIRVGVDEKGVHFLPKPVTPPVLLAKVREMLDARPGT